MTTKSGNPPPKVSCVSGFCIISIFTDISILSVEVIQETQVDLLCNVTGVSVDPTEITWTVDGINFSSNSVDEKYPVRNSYVPTSTNPYFFSCKFY